jgi:myo-inositol-1(or 4)-monophosphatase
MDELIKKIEHIVLECGDIILNADYSDLNIYNKEGKCNIVTKYDELVQNKLKNDLLNILPEATFIGEENNTTSDLLEEGYTFIVDPIDGTTNFSRDIKFSAISVALLKDREVVLAVCYNPYTKELYKAIKGKGAYLNNNKINVSKKELHEAIVLCGSAPYYDELRDKSLKIQRALALEAGDFRRFGSAVLEICFVACGKAEAFFELRLQPWDYAAASLILSEAGGTITDINGDKLQYEKATSVLATNGSSKYLEIIKNI